MAYRRVFITGGAGFIGRWVVNRCLQEGLEVAVYDNLCAGSVENLLESIDRITFYQADILDAVSLSAAMEEFRPEVVFHLAAHHFIPFCDAHPQETLRVNVEGTETVLRHAAKYGARVAVVASSGVVYPSLDNVLNEDEETSPPDVYGLSKLLTEHVTRYISSTTPLTCVAARLFNTYGPYETNQHLIPHIVESLQKGPSVDLGNILSKRDYIYVEDVANLLFHAARRATDPFAVVNVGTGEEYSAEEIIGVLSNLLGEQIEIRVDRNRIRPVDKMHQRAGTERLRDLTGVCAEYSIEEGLRKLLLHEGLLERVSA